MPKTSIMIKACVLLIVFLVFLSMAQPYTSVSTYIKLNGPKDSLDILEIASLYAEKHGLNVNDDRVHYSLCYGGRNMIVNASFLSDLGIEIEGFSPEAVHIWAYVNGSWVEIPIRTYNLITSTAYATVYGSPKKIDRKTVMEIPLPPYKPDPHEIKDLSDEFSGEARIYEVNITLDDAYGEIVFPLYLIIDPGTENKLAVLNIDLKEVNDWPSSRFVKPLLDIVNDKDLISRLAREYGISEKDVYDEVINTVNKPITPAQITISEITVSTNRSRVLTGKGTGLELIEVKPYVFSTKPEEDTINLTHGNNTFSRILYIVPDDSDIINTTRIIYGYIIIEAWKNPRRYTYHELRISIGNYTYTCPLEAWHYNRIIIPLSHKILGEPPDTPHNLTISARGLGIDDKLFLRIRGSFYYKITDPLLFTKFNKKLTIDVLPNYTTFRIPANKAQANYFYVLMTWLYIPAAYIANTTGEVIVPKIAIDIKVDREEYHGAKYEINVRIGNENNKTIIIEPGNYSLILRNVELTPYILGYSPIPIVLYIHIINESKSSGSEAFSIKTSPFQLNIRPCFRKYFSTVPGYIYTAMYSDNSREWTACTPHLLAASIIGSIVSPGEEACSPAVGNPIEVAIYSYSGEPFAGDDCSCVIYIQISPFSALQEYVADTIYSDAVIEEINFEYRSAWSEVFEDIIIKKIDRGAETIVPSIDEFMKSISGFWLPLIGGAIQKIFELSGLSDMIYWITSGYSYFRQYFSTGISFTTGKGVFKIKYVNHAGMHKPLLVRLEACGICYEEGYRYDNVTLVIHYYLYREHRVLTYKVPIPVNIYVSK